MTLAFAGLVGFGSYRYSTQQDRPQAAVRTPELSAAQRMAAHEAACRANATAIHEEANAALGRGDADRALQILRNCEEFLSEQGASLLTKSRTAAAAAAKKHAENMEKAAAARDKAAAARNKAAAAEARSRGVVVGMTKEQVLASSWGRPRSVNTTTNRFGDHEQWVYSGYSYLYFQNGILTSIQTSK